MKANELRIGNWVYQIGFAVQDGYPPNYKKLHQIKEAKEIDFSVYIEPIPLTEEWLLKFGFEVGRESSIMKNWKIGFNDVTYDWLFDIVWIKDVHGSNKNVPFYRNGRHKIEYVHQLQNLYFALTGEELTIKD